METEIRGYVTMLCKEDDVKVQLLISNEVDAYHDERSWLHKTYRLLDDYIIIDEHWLLGDKDLISEKKWGSDIKTCNQFVEFVMKYILTIRIIA